MLVRGMGWLVIQWHAITGAGNACTEYVFSFLIDASHVSKANNGGFKHEM